MRGRKPKPIARQLSEGDPRKQGKRKLAAKLAQEPKAMRGLPSCPQHLRGRARYAWTFWAVELADMKLDNRPDAMMLEGACVNYGRAVDADLLVAREGMMVTDNYVNDEGEVTVLKTKYHPGITVSNAAWRQVRAFCSEFGLSPVSRTRLAIEKKDDPAEELENLLLRPRTARPVVN